MADSDGPIRVVHVIGSLVHGGAETVILMICSGIRRLDSSFEFRICALCEKDSYAEIFAQNDIVVDCLETSPKKPFDVLKKTMHYLHKVRPHIVHTHLAYGDRFGLPAAFLAGIKARVCTLHNLKENRTVYERLTDRLTSLLACRIVAVSDSMGEIWSSQRHMPAGKMTTIKNAASFLAPPHLQQPRTIEPQKSLRCVCIGNIRPVKGHKYAISAMREVVRKYPGATLTIYGNDPDGYAAELNSQIASLALESAVQIKGPIDSALEALAEADIVLIPSQTEGFSIVAVESLSAGVPVIASDIPVHREILGDGEYGIYASPNNAQAFARAAIDLASNPEKYSAFSQKGFARAADFSQESLAEHYLALYKSLVAKL